MAIAFASLLVLVVVAVVAIPILIRVLGEAVSRNPSRPDEEGDETSEGDDGRRSGPGGE